MRPCYFSIITILLLHLGTVEASDILADADGLSESARLVSAARAESLRLRDSQADAHRMAAGARTEAAKKTTAPAAKKRTARMATLRAKLAGVERQRIRDSYRKHQLRFIAARRSAPDSTPAAPVVAGDAD